MAADGYDSIPTVFILPQVLRGTKMAQREALIFDITGLFFL